MNYIRLFRVTKVARDRVSVVVISLISKNPRHHRQLEQQVRNNLLTLLLIRQSEVHWCTAWLYDTALFRKSVHCDNC